MPVRGPLLGHNDNVVHRGTSYHVQTEDLGPRRRQLTSHVFADGGRIVHTLRASYDDLAGEGSSPDAVREHMKSQHRGVIDALRRGDFDSAIASADVDEDGRGGYRYVAPRPEAETLPRRAPPPSPPRRVAPIASDDRRSEPPAASSTQPSPSSSAPPASSPARELVGTPGPATRRGPLPQVRTVAVHPAAAAPRLSVPTPSPSPSPAPSVAPSVAPMASPAPTVAPSPSPPPTIPDEAPSVPVLQVVASSTPPSSAPLALEHPATLRGFGAPGSDVPPETARSPVLRFGEGHAPTRRLDELVGDYLERRRLR